MITLNSSNWRESNGGAGGTVIVPINTANSVYSLNNVYVSGNIGIGTSGPAAPLDVKGNISCNGNTSSNTISTTGNITCGGAISSSSLSTTGNITCGGNLSVANINQSGTIYFPNNGAGLVWGSNFSTIYDNGHLHINTDDNMYLDIANVNALFIDSLRRIGINKTNPQYNLDVNGSIGCSSLYSSDIYSSNYRSSNLYFGNIPGSVPLNPFQFYGTSGGSFQQVPLVYISNDASNAGGGVNIFYSGGAPNVNGRDFLLCNDTSATRCRIASNGGIFNFQANNGNLSDKNLKKDIELAPSYYEKLRKIEFVTFLYNDQTDNEKNLGVIAQQVEEICPELVTETQLIKDDEKMYKSIYQTDFQYATAKALQESIEYIEKLKLENIELKNRINKLEEFIKTKFSDFN